MSYEQNKELLKRKSIEYQDLIKTIIQTEDVSLLPDKLNEVNENDVEILMKVIAKNVKSVTIEEKIRLLKSIMILLKRAKSIKYTSDIYLPISECLIDHKSLFCLKGKLLFIKNCLMNQEEEPENTQEIE